LARNRGASLEAYGISFEAIAEQISRVGRGQPLAALPEGLSFLSDFRVSRQACQKALKRALAREPALAADEFRKIDRVRCKEMFVNL
jgi:hypothetical protein